MCRLTWRAEATRLQSFGETHVYIYLLFSGILLAKRETNFR
jgi:hypothetical protein